jgi:nitroreductase
MRGGFGENKSHKEAIMMRELVTKNRSFRRFQEDRPIGRDTLLGLADLARLTPSGGNKQPLKYVLSWTPEKNALIFDCLAWAGYLTGWSGPAEGERPAGYILILGDDEIAATIPCDHGIAAQTIMLGAAETGLAGCIIGTINRERLRRDLAIPARYQVLLALALGHPRETVVLEEMKEGDYKYWRDEKGVHHVPKRRLSDIILDV